MQTAFGEHLRHPLELTADDRLERRTDLRANVARANGEAEDLAQHLVDPVTGEVIHRADDHCDSFRQACFLGASMPGWPLLS
jgi:hypothetical protein